MNEENPLPGTPQQKKKKGFLSAGKILWAFVFVLAVAVAALLINVWLELQRPPQQPQPAAPQPEKVEVWSPNGASAVPPAAGNPLLPQQPAQTEASAAETDTPQADAAKPAKPKTKAKEEAAKEEKPVQETVLEPVNKTKNSGETVLEPVNSPKPEKPKAEKTAPKRQSSSDMDNLF
ncbi:hypothetical protein HMPREF9120_02004 [Neisseria sp. oral taxon 020 str. F0370]|uniref:hypothetical protein n=1 Tax=Neisseria sp. oral taxon 020 TaxID=712401 RepID=UPI0002A421A0|nr:hypothetical protein [Neisseria sp. oral taxon 020]EKY05018.1 hypothetical protein HMPREF9120_02004 [Neisseria sp. oral taxon 020 str. F0370]